MAFTRFFFIPLLYLAYHCRALSHHQSHQPYKGYYPLNQTSWAGWRSINYLFTFGDSYTTTGFNLTGVLPSSGNPMGNPPYPGMVSSNGPNWVNFLTTTYNQSLVQTYNFAYGGATVDPALVPVWGPYTKSLKEQIQKQFLPTFTIGMPASAPWQAANSLFAIWIGVNDVNQAQSKSELNAEIFKAYTALVEQLYGNGARQFLFLNVPPIDRSPATKRGPMNATVQAINIADFNSRLVGMGDELRRSHGDAVVFQLDVNHIFAMSLNNVSVYPQTAGIQNVSNDCQAYNNGTPSWYTVYSNCSIPVNEYFWLNDLHPTFPIHNATAAQIVELLG